MTGRRTRWPRTGPGTFFWHIDGANAAVPNKATLLTAKEVSDDGGDTEFANTYAAYEALPDAEKAELDGVRVVHSFAASQLLVHPDATPEQRAGVGPRPGRASTRWCGPAATAAGRCWWVPPPRRWWAGPADEGRALLDRLLEWATHPQFVLRHHWRPGRPGHLGQHRPAAPCPALPLRLAPPDAPHDHRRPGGRGLSEPPIAGWSERLVLHGDDRALGHGLAGEDPALGRPRRARGRCWPAWWPGPRAGSPCRWRSCPPRTSTAAPGRRGGPSRARCRRPGRRRGWWCP